MAIVANAAYGVDRESYQQKGDVWFDDGREEQLLAFVKSRSQGQPHLAAGSVLRLIDEFGVSQKYMMNVGAEKGAIVTSLIAKYKPQTMIEFGGYIGYSTILFAEAVRQHGGSRYISFERDPKFAKIAQALVDFANLSHIVQIVVGSSSTSLVREVNDGRLSRANMIFLDHYKPAYIRDLKIAESLGVVKQGTVLVADNVISPGNPPYLEYVRGTPEQRSQKQKEVEKFPARTVNQYENKYDADVAELPGIPGILYESRLIESHEPTGEPDGVEVTICKSVP